MKDVMIDIETLGNRKNSAICQIGAVYFDRHTGELGEKFKVNIDVISAVKSGAEMDGDTVYWWLNQSDAARQSILAEPRLPIEQAFTELNTFLSLHKVTAIWSHATFDFVTIMETYKRLDIKPVFSYKTARDIRTLVDLAKIKIDGNRKREGIHHDGLDDAIYQVKYCVEAFNQLNKLKALSAILKPFIE